MGESARVPRLQWIQSLLHPERRIAQPTLLALEALLRQESSAPGAREQLDAIPELGAIGGIARLADSVGQPVAVARVGRDSLVGFRLTDEGLAEVDVSLDATSGAIRINN